MLSPLQFCVVVVSHKLNIDYDDYLFHIKQELPTFVLLCLLIVFSTSMPHTLFIYLSLPFCLPSINGIFNIIKILLIFGYLRLFVARYLILMHTCVSVYMNGHFHRNQHRLWFMRELHSSQMHIVIYMFVSKNVQRLLLLMLYRIILFFGYSIFSEVHQRYTKLKD